MSDSPGARLGSGRAAEVFEYGPGRIIKLMRDPGHRPDREVAGQQAARAAGIPTPEVFGTTIIEGRAGIIMERIEGLDGLTAASRKPWRVWAVGRATGRVHRQLSGVPAPDGLRDLRALVEERIGTSDTIPEAARERLKAILALAPDGDRLCHLDLHPGNIIESPAGPIVIDFSNAASGHPMADHARSLLTFDAGEPPDDTPRHEQLLIAAGRSIARRGYQSGYGPVDREALALWMPLMVALRLGERIPQERTRLLRLLSRSLRTAGALV